MLTGITEYAPLKQLPLCDEIQLGGFVVHVETDDRRIIHAIQSSTDNDLSQSDGILRNEERSTHVNLRLSSRLTGRPVDLPSSGNAASFFESLELHVWDREHLLVVDRKSVVAVDPVTGHADGYISPEHLESPWILAHRIFYLSVIELLRCHRAYYIHAGCVCDGDEGILVCGASGGGKSTLTYALARSGFSYLSDDGVFLRKNSGGLEIFSFPEKIKLDSRSCSFFEELAHLGGRPGKREIPLRDTRICRFSQRARPVALIFPVRSKNPTSEIRRIAGHDALVRLLGQSIPVLRSMDVQAQLDALTELVEVCGCFELNAACDFDDVPNLVANAVGARV
jgi:hypothetical protein